MAFKNSLKQQSNSQFEKKKKDQSVTSISTIDSCSSSRFSFQSGFNGNPSPSLRLIEGYSETAIDKQRTPNELLSNKSMTSFSDMVNYLQENDEKCHKISEQIDESFSDGSDDDDHCIWDNSEAESLGIDCKDFLNVEGNAFNFYQMYSIRSQLYQPTRVLRSTTIEEVNTISKFYKKPVKLTELINQQAFLDGSCTLFQQLPSLNSSGQKSQTQISSSTTCIKNTQEQSQKQTQIHSAMSISCAKSRNKVEVKNIDITVMLKDIESLKESSKTDKQSVKTQPYQLEETTPKKIIPTTSVTSPTRAIIPVKKFNLNDIINPYPSSMKTMPDFDDTSYEIDTKQFSTLSNIPLHNNSQQTLNQVLLTPQKRRINHNQNIDPKKVSDITSAGRLNSLQKSASKISYPLSANRNLRPKKISFQQNLNQITQQETPSSFLSKSYSKKQISDSQTQQGKNYQQNCHQEQMKPQTQRAMLFL